jgi:hypothetical protein
MKKFYKIESVDAIELFTDVIYGFSKRATVFVPVVCPLQAFPAWPNVCG